MYRWGLRDSGMGACTDERDGIRVLHGESDDVAFIPAGDLLLSLRRGKQAGRCSAPPRLLPARDLGAPSAGDDFRQEHFGSASMF